MQYRLTASWDIQYCSSLLSRTRIIFPSHSILPVLKGAMSLYGFLSLAGKLGLNSHSVASMPVGALLACCQELVAMDKEASRARLTHFTPHDKLGAHLESFSTLTRQLRKHT